MEKTDKNPHDNRNLINFCIRLKSRGGADRSGQRPLLWRYVSAALLACFVVLEIRKWLLNAMSLMHGSLFDAVDPEFQAFPPLNLMAPRHLNIPAEQPTISVFNQRDSNKFPKPTCKLD